MDPSRAAALRDLLAQADLTKDSARFGHELRRVTRRSDGLLLFGPPTEEPWHLTAHIGDELHFAGVDDLRPALVRWQPEPDAPAQLSVGLDRLTEAGRGSSLVVVSEDASTPDLLERIADVRRRGAVIFGIGRERDRELADLSHELLVPTWPDGFTTATGGEERSAPVELDAFETAQHFVSLSIGEDPQTVTGTGWRRRLRRLIQHVGD